MEGLMVTFSSLLLIYSAYSQASNVNTISQSSVVLNVSTDMTTPTPVVRCQTLDILSDLPCLLTDCGQFRKISCNRATVRDLQAVFAKYAGAIDVNKLIRVISVNDSGALEESMPLFVKLTGGEVNLTNQLFQLVAKNLEKLELSHVDLSPFLHGEPFANLTNLKVLDLDNVSMEVISNDAFTGLRSLRALSIKNPPNLRALDPHVFDPLINSSLQCLNLEISNCNFTCDCQTNVWIQQTFRNSTLINNSSCVDIFAENSVREIPGIINVTCSWLSAQEFRKDVFEIDLNATCSQSQRIPNHIVKKETFTEKPSVATVGIVQRSREPLSPSGSCCVSQNLLFVVLLFFSLLANSYHFL